MTVRAHEWIQRTWERAGQDTYDKEGDFSNAVGLYPNHARTKLKRAPAWATHVAWPDNFEGPEGAFFDRATGNHVFLGKQTSDDHLASVYYSSTWTPTGPNDLTIDVSTYGALCGYSRRNLRYWGGKVYLITDNFDVYATTSYEVAPTKLWDATGGLSARTLFPYGDRLWFVDNQGTVYRLNAAADAFNTFYTPIAPLDIRFATAYHQYLALLSRADDGALSILRLPDVNPYIIHEVATVQGTTGNEIWHSPYTDGALYANHRDRLFFTSGWYVPTTGTIVDLYSFNGAYIEHIAQATQLPTAANTRSAGLDVWRDELILWYARTDTNSHKIRMLVGDGLIDFLDLDAPASDYTCLYMLDGELVIVAKDKSSNEGFYHTSGLQDGYLITSWLDFGRPGRLKRLNRITVHLDTADPDLDVILKYRINDTDAWTTAATCTDTRTAAADPKDIEFWRVQLRVDLDDDSGHSLDVGIDLLSILYAVNE